VLPDRLVRQSARVRDRGVLDKHVTATEHVANTLRRSGDRTQIRLVELQCMGVRANIARRRFAAFVVSRSDQHREAVCREILCNLKSDSLICIGYGSNGFSCMAIALS
jgi:hypothetical protein